MPGFPQALHIFHENSTLHLEFPAGNPAKNAGNLSYAWGIKVLSMNSRYVSTYQNTYLLNVSVTFFRKKTLKWSECVCSPCSFQSVSRPFKPEPTDTTGKIRISVLHGRNCYCMIIYIYSHLVCHKQLLILNIFVTRYKEHLNN